jgi:hypothetical protein
MVDPPRLSSSKVEEDFGAWLVDGTNDGAVGVDDDLRTTRITICATRASRPLVGSSARQWAVSVPVLALSLEQLQSGCRCCAEGTRLTCRAPGSCILMPRCGERLGMLPGCIVLNKSLTGCWLTSDERRADGRYAQRA